MVLGCPSCGKGMKMQRTSGGMAHVSCACGIGGVQEFRESEDLTFMDFCVRYDEGKVGKPPSAGRDKGEIDAMVRRNRPDHITEEILRTKDDYIAEYRVLEGPGPEMGGPVGKAGLDASIVRGLEGAGIKNFFKFQDEAMRRILGGEDVVIEAPTASGKTEAFLIPILQMILERGRGGVCALLVYPTKALARDQFSKMPRITAGTGVRAAVFDGDTKPAERGEIIRNPPHVIITNFDVIHYHMRKRTGFASLLGAAKVIVVDEVHQYTGTFGSNVHHIMKRLGRMCGGLQVVAASATLDDPGRFCGSLFGKKMRVIGERGRRGRTDLIMIFPELQKQRALMIGITERMTRAGHKTMVFSNSHRNAELLAMQARKRKVDVMVHRAGLTAAYRNMVERRFRDGALGAVSCTPTLELGIDIGDVDCVVSGIVPVNRLLQRIGRAARKGQRGYAFLALGNDPISQYYRNHPGDYFEDGEGAHIDPKNPFIEEMQVLAMACDRGMMPDEAAQHKEVVERHITNGVLCESGGMIVPDMKRAAAKLDAYSIRGIGDTVDIILDGAKAGDRAVSIAIEELHKDAIYLLAGRRYRVTGMDHTKRMRAVIERVPPKHPFYTRALVESRPTIVEEFERRDVRGTEAAFCRLEIEKRVYGYVNIGFGDDAGPGEKVMLEEPLTYTLDTKGLVFRAPRPAGAIGMAEDTEFEEGIQKVMGGEGCGAPEYVEASGYHAAEHVVIEGSNMIIGGASQDLGGISMGISGMIYVHDGAVGGSGASRALYERLEKVFGRGRDIIAECPCTRTDGCPRCTYSYKCGNNNEFLHKAAALEVFERIKSGERAYMAGHGDGRPLV